MLNIKNVYTVFNEVRLSRSNKKFKLPKNWESKLLPDQIDIFTKIYGYFLTKWSNIDVKRYMESGFDLYRRFTYKDILRPDIIKHYIEQDKVYKRRTKLSKRRIDNSFRYIERDVKSFCILHDGNKNVIIEYYLKNKIDTLVLVYCIYHKYLIPTEDEKQMLYNIYNRYDELVKMMFKAEDHIKGKFDDYKEKR